MNGNQSDSGQMDSFRLQSVHNGEKGQCGPCMSQVDVIQMALGRIEVGRGESNLVDSVQYTNGKKQYISLRRL